MATLKELQKVRKIPEPIFLDPNRNRTPFSVSRCGGPIVSAQSVTVYLSASQVGGWWTPGGASRKYGEAVEHLESNAL